MTLKSLQYKLNDNLEYLEVIPCRPEIFLEFQQYVMDHHYTKTKVRIHFPSFEYYGTLDKFEFIINDMEKAVLPETIKSFFPTNNQYLGIRTTENSFSDGWWKAFELYNLRHIRIDCRWGMLDWLVTNKDKLLRSFGWLNMIELRLNQVHNTWEVAKQKLDEFLNVFAGKTVSLAMYRRRFADTKFGSTACGSATVVDVGNGWEEATYICFQSSPKSSYNPITHSRNS